MKPTSGWRAKLLDAIDRKRLILHWSEIDWRAQAESQEKFDSTAEICAVLTNGVDLLHESQKSLMSMRLDTLIVKGLFDLAEEVSADRAQAMVMENIAAEDWHEQCLFLWFGPTSKLPLKESATVRGGPRTTPNIGTIVLVGNGEN
jgi:hypothetical protein